MNTPTRVQQHDAWVRTVHDVAKYRSEGPRRIVTGGKNGCILEYEVAPLDQGYALKYGLEFPGYAGTYIGWTHYPTREAAIDELIAACSSRCHAELSPLPSACSGHHKAAAAAMLELLQPQSLFGYQEPEPAPRDEWLGDVIARSATRLARLANRSSGVAGLGSSDACHSAITSAYRLWLSGEPYSPRKICLPPMQTRAWPERL